MTREKGRFLKNFLMTSFDLTLHSSLGNDGLESEPETKGGGEDGLTEPEPGEETASGLKKPARKDPAEDDTLEPADNSEPEVDNSYIKDFGDGTAE